jgi:hypothetical protein
MANRVLIACHSQVKYFDQYLNASNVDVLSFLGYRIEEMWGPRCHRAHGAQLQDCYASHGAQLQDCYAFHKLLAPM